MLKTGLVYDAAYLKHETSYDHPESPRRLVAIMEHLEKTGILAKLELLKPRKAEIEWIETVHTPSYVQEVLERCFKGEEYLHSPDTPICSASFEVALLAVGGTLTAIDEIMSGHLDNAFCAVRPPGHHAEKDRAMGFCLFNNVAIAARYIQQKYGLERILIIDWDVHHGNGTQHAFESDPTVFYFSIHEHPTFLYPGTGRSWEKGTGKGEGFTLNYPVEPHAGYNEYCLAFEKFLKPAALRFSPQFILISAGFDGHKDDPLAHIALTSEQYGHLMVTVKEIADQCCQGRIISVLEGGYDLKALAESVAFHISALMADGTESL